MVVSGWPCQQYVTVTLHNYKNNTHTSTIGNTDRQGAPDIDVPDTTPGATEWVTATGLSLYLPPSLPLPPSSSPPPLSPPLPLLLLHR